MKSGSEDNNLNSFLPISPVATKNPKNCLNVLQNFSKSSLNLSGFTSINPIKTPKSQYKSYNSKKKWIGN